MSGLTTTQLREFKNRLQARREELRDEIHNELIQQEQESYAELAGRVRDTGDDSIVDVFTDMNIAIINKQLEEMADIENTLLRVSDGSYGICIDCSGEIDVARLEAYPTAKRCITCQAHHEDTFAGKETPSI